MRLFLAMMMGLCALATPAHAVLRVDISSGIQAPMPIAVPHFATSAVVATPAGSTQALGQQVADVVQNDLASTGLFRPIDRAAFTTQVAYGDVMRPQFPAWRTIAAQALVTGFVTANADGSLTVGCYLYDVFSQEELARQGFNTQPAFWRRAAHKCADLIYTRLTGEGPYFDSRVVYVSETGPKINRTKRLAIMDQDGANHRFLTNGQNLVLTPRFAPQQQMIAYMSYAGNRPRVYIYHIGTGRQEIIGDFPGMSFAPRFSPDGRSLVFSMAQGGSTDIFRMDIATRAITRLTTAPGIDTAPSYSPDGSKIAFESDRSGTQQIYVMDADGSNQQRISFGQGRYATPVWSPRGDIIAFTRIGGGQLAVGVMRTDGSGERMLTNGWADEGPTWSPNGRVLMFFRTARGSGKAELWSVDLTGVNERRISTPLDGSDPAWSPILE